MKTVIINLLDWYGVEIPLQIFGKKQKKSSFGVFMGLLSLGFISTITIYFLMTLFSRDTKQIISNTTNTLIPVNDLTTMPFLFSMYDPVGRLVRPTAGIYELWAQFFRNDWVNGSQVGDEILPMKLRQCTRDDVLSIPISDEMLPFYMCIPHGKYNLTLKGILNDNINGYSFMHILLTKCNSKNNPNCQNSTVIDSIFSGGYFNLNTWINVVDHDNNTSPYAVNYVQNQIATSITIFKRMTLSYTQNLYTDDSGFVFESLVTHDFFTQGETTHDYDLISGVNSSAASSFWGGGELVAFFQILNDRNVVSTKRTFLKSQTILANIGGVIKFIMVCAQIITQFVVRRNVFVEVGNAVFNYKQAENEKSEKSENKFLKVGRSENVVKIFVNNPQREEIINTPLENKKLNSIRKNFELPSKPKRENQEVERLSMTTFQLFCFAFCIKNKKVMGLYEATEKAILDKISVHSIVKDSFNLKKLTKLTLNSEHLKLMSENSHIPFGEI